MDRRSFFKLAVAGVAAAAVPSLVLEASPLLPTQRVVGSVREVVAYDVTWDRFVARYDIMFGEGKTWTQLGVDAIANSESDTENCRETALLVLGNELKHRGLSWGDLRPLPEVRGMKTAYI